MKEENSLLNKILSLTSSIIDTRVNKYIKKEEVSVNFNLFHNSNIRNYQMYTIYINNDFVELIKLGAEIFYEKGNNKFTYGIITEILQVQLSDSNNNISIITVYIRSKNIVTNSNNIGKVSNVYVKDWLQVKHYFELEKVDTIRNSHYYAIKSSIDYGEWIRLELEMNARQYNLTNDTFKDLKITQKKWFWRSNFRIPGENKDYYYIHNSRYNILNHPNDIDVQINDLIHIVDDFEFKLKNIYNNDDVIIAQNIWDTTITFNNNNNNLKLFGKNIPNRNFSNFDILNNKLTSFKYNGEYYCVGALHEFIPIYEPKIKQFIEPKYNNLGQREIINNLKSIPICKCSKSGVDMEIVNISRKEDIIVFKVNNTHNNFEKYKTLNEIYNLPTNLNYDKNNVLFDINGYRCLYDSVDCFHIKLINTNMTTNLSSSCMYDELNNIRGIVIGKESVTLDDSSLNIYNTLNTFNKNNYNDNNNIIYMVPIQSIIRCLNKQPLKDLPFRISYSNNQKVYYSSNNIYSSIINIYDDNNTQSVLTNFNESTELTNYDNRINQISDYENWKNINVLNLIPLDMDSKFGLGHDANAAVTINDIKLSLDNTQDSLLKTYAEGAIIILSRGLSTFSTKRNFCKLLKAKAFFLINTQEGSLSMGGTSDNLLSISFGNQYMKYFENASIKGYKFSLLLNNFYTNTENKEWIIKYKYNENDEYMDVINTSTINMLNIEDKNSQFGVIDRFNHNIDYTKPIYIKLIKSSSNTVRIDKDFYKTNTSDELEKEFTINWNDINNMDDILDIPNNKLTNLKKQVYFDNIKNIRF